MTMTEFTKGTWSVYTSDDCDYTDDETIVIGLDSYNKDPTQYFCAHKIYIDVNDSEALANANLIAAAPDMYELLDNIRRLCEWGYNETELGGEMLTSLNEIKDQLKKARGE